MQPGEQENLERLLRVLAGTLADEREGRPAEPQDTDWVIERIQDLFDSRAR